MILEVGDWSWGQGSMGVACGNITLTTYRPKNNRLEQGMSLRSVTAADWWLRWANRLGMEGSLTLPNSYAPTERSAIREKGSPNLEGSDGSRVIAEVGDRA